MTQPKKLRVNMISESVFTVKGHGVHTAFIEMTAALEDRPDVDVKVNTFRPADITHIQTVGLYSLLHLLFGRGKKVVSVHVIPDSFVGSLVGVKYWYGLSVWYLKFFYGRADRLLAVSEVVKQTLQTQLKVTKPIEVLYNTVDRQKYAHTLADRAQARQSLSIDEQKNVVLGNGQVQPRKRYDIFIETAKKMPEALFIWVGGIPFKSLGADHKKMESLIQSAPSNVITTGVIDLSEVKKYFWAADVFFLPSNQENHPLAVVEAAASGLPIVVRDIKEYDASFGNDVVRGNDETFQQLISQLLTDKKRADEAVKGANRIIDRFDNVAGGQHLMDAYVAVLGKNPTAS